MKNSLHALGHHAPGSAAERRALVPLVHDLGVVGKDARDGAKRSLHQRVQGALCALQRRLRILIVNGRPSVRVIGDAPGRLLPRSLLLRLWLWLKRNVRRERGQLGHIWRVEKRRVNSGGWRSREEPAPRRGGDRGRRCIFSLGDWFVVLHRCAAAGLCATSKTRYIYGVVLLREQLPKVGAKTAALGERSVPLAHCLRCPRCRRGRQRRGDAAMGRGRRQVGPDHPFPFIRRQEEGDLPRYLVVLPPRAAAAAVAQPAAAQEDAVAGGEKGEGG